MLIFRYLFLRPTKFWTELFIIVTKKNQPLPTLIKFRRQPILPRTVLAAGMGLWFWSV